MPEQAYSRATLGIYEMNRVELLRDLYLWAYGRSTQEYLAIMQDLAEPDPLRLARPYQQTVRGIVTTPQLDPLITIQQAESENIPQQARPALQALIIEELRRLHEGILVRYGLRPSEFTAWKAQHGRRLTLVHLEVLLGMADEMLHPFRPKDANLEQLKSSYANHTQVADAVDTHVYDSEVSISIEK